MEEKEEIHGEGEEDAMRFIRADGGSPTGGQDESTARKWSLRKKGKGAKANKRASDRNNRSWLET